MEFRNSYCALPGLLFRNQRCTRLPITPLAQHRWALHWHLDAFEGMIVSEQYLYSNFERGDDGYEQHACAPEGSGDDGKKVGSIASKKLRELENLIRIKDDVIGLKENIINSLITERNKEKVLLPFEKEQMKIEKRSIAKKSNDLFYKLNEELYDKKMKIKSLNRMISSQESSLNKKDAIIIFLIVVVLLLLVNITEKV